MARSKARTSNSCSMLESGVFVMWLEIAQPASKKIERHKIKIVNRLIGIAVLQSPYDLIENLAHGALFARSVQDFSTAMLEGDTMLR